MSADSDVMTIEKNDLFRTRPPETELANLREEWRRAVAGSIVKAIRAALESENKSGGQISFLMASFIEQLQLNSEKVAPELRNLFSEPIKLSQLSVGNTKYPFRRDSVACYVREYKVLVLGSLQSVDIRGHGETPEEAVKDVAIKVHTAYQHLSRLLPSELNEDDHFVLKTIVDLVDIHEHKNLTPAIRRKIGIVTCRYPFRIKWWGDEKETNVDLCSSPGELASYELGAWFDAAVEYDRKYKKVKQILTAKRLPPRAEKPYDNQQLAQEMNELKKISPDDI